MQKTKALGALKVKSLFPPIHHPLPLNKRESERLLNTIKASFRAQLDKEYSGAPASALKPSSLPAPTITYLPQSDPGEHVAAPSTDRLLHAILKNPLFNSQTEPIGPPDGAQSTWDAHKAVFERAVARGLMTIRRAHGFLILVESEVKHSTTLSVLDGIKPAGAGRLVLRWLRASGQERDLSFLANQAFTRLLLRFVVAEGLDDVVWSWIDHLMKREHASNQPLAGLGHSSAVLLRNFVEGKAGAVELDGAYAALLKGEAMVKENSLPPRTLFYAWGRVAWQTTVESWKHTKPSVDLFEPFVALGGALSAGTQLRAHLALHHPTEPSSNLAVTYLSHESVWEEARSKARSKARANKKRYLQGLTSLAIDTVMHLMHADQAQDATRIWELLRENLGWLDGGLHRSSA